jgi:hypothetical protein
MDGFIAKPFAMATVGKALKQLLMQGHCWPDGPARRILDVNALGQDFTKQDWGFEIEVLQARTALQELVEKLDALTPEQCMERAELLAGFARRHGLLKLAPVMETLAKAARDGEAELFVPQLAEERADFEHAMTAIRAWRHHMPEPLRMSA